MAIVAGGEVEIVGGSDGRTGAVGGGSTAQTTLVC